MDHATTRTFMLILRLPGNVEAQVNSFRMQLFGETSAVSTQALPPVIPLARLSRPVEGSVVDTLPQTELQPLAVGETRRVSETLVIHVAFPDGWKRWLSNQGVGLLHHAPDASRDQPKGPLPGQPPGLAARLPPALAGIFLGDSDLVQALHGLPLPERPGGIARQLQVVHVELLALTLPAVGEWWSELDWEVRWSRRVKLRGA